MLIGFMLVAEFVRGIVKALRGTPPDKWDFVAIGSGGAAAGLWFESLIALMWGAKPWSEYLLVTAAGAGVYIIIGACLYWEERRKMRAARES